MQPNPISDASKVSHQLPEKRVKKTKGQNVSDLASPTIKRSSSDSFKMEKSFTASEESHEVAPEKISKRAKLKGLARKVIAPISKMKTSFASGCSTAVDKTYVSKIDGNNDIAFADKTLRCLYVVDGSGHDNELMKRDLEQVFTSFNVAYKDATKGLKFTDLEEAKAHVCGYMNALHNMIRTMADEVNQKIAEGEKEPFGISFTDEGEPRDFNAGKLPAMSFGQVVKIEGESFLISAQYGDTSLVIQRSGQEELDFSLVDTEHDNPIGKREIRVSEVRSTPLNAGDRILACSDGIMEFIQAHEFQEIAQAHPEATAPVLLAAFKERVLENGEKLMEKSAKERKKYLESTTSTLNENALLGANQRTLKTYNPEDRKFVDDISLSILTVN